MLTKVFVLLLVIFSMTFTVMTIAVASKTVNWKRLADTYQDHAATADAHLRSMIASSNAELATVADLNRDLQDNVRRLEMDLRGKGEELATTVADKRKLEAEKRAVDAMNNALVAQLQAAEGARNEYRKQRDDLERQAIELQRRNVDLNDRVSEQTARIAVLSEQKRHYEQQLNILKQENDRLARATQGGSVGDFESPSGAAMPNVRARTPVRSGSVSGRITDVSEDVLTVSVGSADGVTEGMIFVIYRGDRYVGDLAIELVQPNESVGRLMRSAEAPRVGDQVEDERSMATSTG